MLSLILPFFIIYIYIYIDFPVANPVVLADFSLQPCLLFSLLLQSKHKEDVSITRPILLDEPKFEVHLSPSLFFFFACVSFATCLCLSRLVTGSFVLHPFLFFLFFRMSPSLSLYITPQLRSFLPPWAHPWKASLMGLMLCLGP